jgi:hypothetical protein
LKTFLFRWSIACEDEPRRTSSRRSFSLGGNGAIAVFNLKLSFDGSMLMVCPIYFQDKLVFQEVEDLGRHDGKIAVTAQ